MSDKTEPHANNTYPYGLFQVRSRRANKGTGPARTRDERVGRWGMWSTYTSGMYLAYMQERDDAEGGWGHEQSGPA